MEAGAEEAEKRLHAAEAVFEHLKPYCMQLLTLLQNQKKPRSPPFLREMACFLRRAPARSLQPCLDYTLVPLLLLLDAAVACRSRKDLKSVQSHDLGDSPIISLDISDNVAEGTLVCLEELFKKCHLNSVDQLIAILKKITVGALLSPAEASEEFREGIIRCFRSLLLGLQPCANESCNCKEITKSQYISTETLRSLLVVGSELGNYPRECLLAFLRSPGAAAIVGHWLSLLLQAAEVEVARGLSGSAQLRTEAFLTIRILVARVGTSDALAFFLPGTVSRFAKALHLSKTMVSGAAGSADSIDQAIRGLAEFLVTIMNDDSNLQGVCESIQLSKGCHLNGGVNSLSILETLRNLSSNNQAECLSSKGDSTESSITHALQNIKCEHTTKSLSNERSLQVSRTTEWIEETASHADRILAKVFPPLCLHPSEKVRKAVVDGTRGLLANCTITLKRCKLMLLECLCLLVCDDFATVHVPARGALEYFFRVQKNVFSQNEIDDLLNRLIDSLPRAILGNDLTLAVSHARKLFALMYYGGPELLVSNILCSPGRTSHFMDAMTLSLSQNSQFVGSLDKLMLSKQCSLGYLHSMTELSIDATSVHSNSKIMRSDSSLHSKVSPVDDMELQKGGGFCIGKYELPQMPPWFIHKGSEKLYVALASILRLFGFCIRAGRKGAVPLSTIFDTPLDVVRKLVSDIRMKEYNKESWKSWYTRSSSGQLLRNASTAVCILNEIVYGTSNQSAIFVNRMFQTNYEEPELYAAFDSLVGDKGDRTNGSKEYLWNGMRKNVNDTLTQFVGSILNEYLASEIWDLPIDHKSFHLMRENDGDLSLHFFNEATILQQVIIDGIGIFSMTIENNFKTSGYMQNCLNLLLENLICSNNKIRVASDAVLNVLAAAVGYPTVRHLVVENADYIVDYLCRQMRHLDLNPHTPHILSAMFSYIGASHEILPLLEEPMRIVSLELEVIACHQHPKLTDPFLKAVAEIAKASRSEASKLPEKGKRFSMKIKNELSDLKSRKQISDPISLQASESSQNVNHSEIVQLEYWETLQFESNETRKYRRIVGSIASSCLKAATPLLASKLESTCLVALDAVEAGCDALNNVEEAYKLEKEAKGLIEEAIQLCLFMELEIEDAADEVDENRLLPAVNKIWPHLILCLKNKASVAAVQHCMHVISCMVQISGGDFFTRRFRNDGSVIWKMLSSSPFQRKPVSLKEEGRILLPYRSTSLTSEDSISEVSSLKVQEAALIMIAEISKNKRSATAVETVLKKVSGLVVGIACSSVSRLRDAALKALSGLSCIDPDLIWLLVADIYYNLKSKDIPEPPTSDLPEIQELLPVPFSSKDYLYLQYGENNISFDVDPQSVAMVFHKLQLDNHGMYCV